MADTLPRRSPLQNWHSRFAELPDSVHVGEEPFTAMVDLWVDPSGTGGAAACDVLGIAALPSAPSTMTDAPGLHVIWFGPQEWLLTATDCSGKDLEARLRAALDDHGGAAVDVSAQRTSLRLRGANALHVLAKGCALDLHPTVFGPGAAAQTMLGQAGVVLIPLDDDGTDYRILVRSSFACYLAQWLIDAAEEYALPW
jgi:sarcosine oxidase subunit gamma